MITKWVFTMTGIHGKNANSDRSQGETPGTLRERLCLSVISVLNPELSGVMDRIVEVPELLYLADIISVGENQLHHVLRMCQLSLLISDSVLEELGVDRRDLVETIIFHDLGKGQEIDDRYFQPDAVAKVEMPKKLSKYRGLKWAEWKEPFHDHVLAGYELGIRYCLKPAVLEAIALHHHVKMRPEFITKLGAVLSLTGTVCQDIATYAPEQYAASGSNLARIVAFLDQLCAVERKLKTNVVSRYSEDRLEEDVVRDLVIGITDKNDPRLRVLGVSITGTETVILIDLSAFGSYVKMHSEYEIQRVKKAVLQAIRSVVRNKKADRDWDLVSLIGGDEYVVITKVVDQAQVEAIIDRIAKMVKIHAGLNIRPGYGIGKSIIANFHTARSMAEVGKRTRFLR